MSPLLVVLSSPSGGGKSTIAADLLRERDDLGFSVSATTRRPRTEERDGIEYHFLTRAAFVTRRDAGDFLEWAEYSGNLYGTLESEVDRVLAAGQHVVLDIEVQGARQIRERRSAVVSIFILPPSAEDLLDRLGGRKTDHMEAVRQRLRRAVDEVAEASLYDYVVVNDVRAECVREVSAIIGAETRRTRRFPDLQERIMELQRGLARVADRL